jgi:hypothetical protein
VSASLVKLCGCVRALLSLLYPMEWRHTVVSACPTVLADLVCSPTPYIIGVSPACFASLSPDAFASVVVARLDEKLLHAPSALPPLPGERSVCKQLRQIARALKWTLRSDEANALIAQQVANIYSAFWLGWQIHTVPRQPGAAAVLFDAAAFARSRPAATQPLAEHFCKSTMFFDAVHRLEQQDARVTNFLSLRSAANGGTGSTASDGSGLGLRAMLGRRAASAESLSGSETSSVGSSAFVPELSPSHAQSGLLGPMLGLESEVKLATQMKLATHLVSYIEAAIPERGRVMPNSVQLDSEIERVSQIITTRL